MKFHNYLLFSLFYVLTACAANTEQETAQQELTRLEVSQQVLDFYTKYSKGYYDAMQSNFADKVALFFTATHITSAQAIEEIKARAKATPDAYFIPDISSLTIVNQVTKVKVAKKTTKGTQEMLWAHIRFNQDQQIVSYKEVETQPGKVAAKETNYSQYNGLYMLKGEKSKALAIKWQQGSELTYAVSLSVPDCMGEFSGKAFFIDNHTAASGDVTSCKIIFDMATPDVITITETAGCRNEQTKACKFAGVYQKEMVSVR